MMSRLICLMLLIRLIFLLLSCFRHADIAAADFADYFAAAKRYAAFYADARYAAADYY